MKDIYLKMTKEWGGFKVGEVVRFGYTKGVGRIENGEGIKVPKQQAVNEPEPKKKEPEAETAMVDLTVNKKVETAVVAPRKRAKSKKVKE